jgi:hypothetical protein
MNHPPEDSDDATRLTRRLTFSPPTLVERVASWLMLLVLVVAAFYFFVFGSVPQCDETLEQCEASVGPYLLR